MTIGIVYKPLHVSGAVEAFSEHPEQFAEVHPAVGLSLGLVPSQFERHNQRSCVLE